MPWHSRVQRPWLGISEVHDLGLLTAHREPLLISPWLQHVRRIVPINGQGQPALPNEVSVSSITLHECSHAVALSGAALGQQASP